MFRHAIRRAVAGHRTLLIAIIQPGDRKRLDETPVNHGRTVADRFIQICLIMRDTRQNVTKYGPIESLRETRNSLENFYDSS